ncbi:PREDICTED: uncharacterized protein LOC108562709 [Nicrophorus vespilloides]|uniref:Uncharacterized protein LOC108562709 n=1 Tax=Nicrophorus vespilloides TaxID=110193 RepID=A0ABM1MPV6_NICVS|nr:PREDICTED: uncharacterized protein LOC108562709 [Nicrophorus vespilloides]XP_017776606.1 PREDICTED: uncharacterized protein LOC108562709 [Nicrophorus vespilloides]XP_017776607.1 PREDICTED: uncharacterized protein LOC108562709 [Nicrophorus vespilloides]XP_017776608.1 PREDICTED: uncharacterized protein LOC108562709 [Nicrophorus vespilloides]
MKVMKELQQDMEPYNFRVNDLNTPNDNQQSNTILFWSIVIFLKIVCVGLVILAVIITKDKHNENRVQMIGSKDAATMKRLIHSRPKMLSLEDDNKVFNSTILSSFFKQTMIYSINPPTAVTAQTTPYKKTSALMSIKDHSNDVKSAKFKGIRI